MATERQTAANRRNAQKSTGPTSEAGKAASSTNGTTHGFAARRFVLSIEERPEFDQLRDSLLDEHQPAGPTELFQIDQMAEAMWRLRRLRATESAYLDNEMERHASNARCDYRKPGPWDRLAHAYRWDASNSNTLTNLSRYDARIERAYYRALHELHSLQDRRRSQAAPAPSPQVSDTAQHPRAIGFARSKLATIPRVAADSDKLSLLSDHSERVSSEVPEHERPPAPTS